MSEHYPHIRRYVDCDGESILALRESVRITFHMRRDHQEVGPAVLRALEVYRRAIVPHALKEYPDHPNKYTQGSLPLDEKGWAHVRTELLEQIGTSLWLSETGGPTGYTFFYEGRPLDGPLDSHGRGNVCTASFILPTEYLEEHGPERLRELALELARGLPFISGHGGLFLQGVNGPDGIREEAFRYPGLDVTTANAATSDIGLRVDGVHWLNFLGQPVLGELGGVEGLRTRLHSPGTTVQELEGERAVVTLGPWPEAGDLEQGRTLPAYRELARALEPWRYVERFSFHGFSDEDMRRWQRRFLD
jgi:hypothetical protein